MKTKKIEQGEVVKLKSSGPEMTVESVKNKKAKCCWFDCAHHQVLRDEFCLHSLCVVIKTRS